MLIFGYYKYNENYMISVATVTGRLDANVAQYIANLNKKYDMIRGSMSSRNVVPKYF